MKLLYELQGNFVRTGGTVGGSAQISDMTHPCSQAFAASGTGP